MLRKALKKERSNLTMLISAYLWKKLRILNQLVSPSTKNLNSTVFLSRLQVHKLALKLQLKTTM